MNTPMRTVMAVIINGITVYGVYGLGWGVGTAIALYWCENVIGIALISLLFVLHRAMTHKRGHDRAVLQNFLLVTVPFTFGHGLFLAALLALAFPRFAPEETFNVATFKTGLLLVGGAMLGRFLIDAVRLKTLPFAHIRVAADSFAPRIFVVHVTIIVGTMAMAAAGHVRAFFAVFAVLKFAGDLIAFKVRQELPEDELVAEA